MQKQLFVLVLLLVVAVACASSAANNSTAITPKRIVFCAVPGLMGHASSQVALANELSRRKTADGAPVEVYFVNAASARKLFAKDSKVHFVEVPEMQDVSNEDMNLFSDLKFPGLFGAGWRFLSQTFTENYISFQGAMKQLVEEGKKPDLVIGEQVTPAASLVAHYYGIPYHRLFSNFYLLASPRTVSAFSEIFFLVIKAFCAAVLHFRIHPVQDKLGVPRSTLNEFMGSEAGVNILPYVPGMEQAVQFPSNYVQVGPLIQVDNLKLHDEMTEWFEDISKHPEPRRREVIYIGLSTVHEASTEMKNKIVETAAMLPYSVVWSLRDHQKAGLAATIPSNLKIVPWVNQHAMLSHPQVKLFVSHCGINGLSEAVYFGKPLICIPLAADQPWNSHRAERMGYGKHIDKDTFTSIQLNSTITEVLSSTLRDKVKRLQKAIELAGGVQRAADHIMTYFEIGTEHIRPADRDLSWYERLSLDFASVMPLLLLVGYSMLKCTLRCCCRRNKVKQH